MKELRKLVFLICEGVPVVVFSAQNAARGLTAGGEVLVDRKKLCKACAREAYDSGDEAGECSVAEGESIVE